ARTAEIAVGLNRFSTNGLREWERLAVDGRRTLAEVERTFKNIDKNPSRLIFGGSNASTAEERPPRRRLRRALSLLRATRLRSLHGLRIGLNPPKRGARRRKRSTSSGFALIAMTIRLKSPDSRSRNTARCSSAGTGRSSASSRISAA